jgi:hypothetical protein
MSDIHEVELHIEDAQRLVDRRDAIHRLHANPDFRLVIEQGYLRDEAVRQVHLSVSENANEETRKASLDAARSGGYLKQFLSAAIRMGDTAESSIKSHRELLDEMRAEEHVPAE